MTKTVAVSTLTQALSSLEGAGVEFSLTDGLILPDDLSYENYERVGAILGQFRDWTARALGEWLLFGDGHYKDRTEQAALATGRSPETLADYARVVGRVARVRWHGNLSFSHHRAVAALPPAEQTAWLDRAETERLSATELKAKVSVDSRDGPDVKPVPNSGRTIDVARRIVATAADLGDGRDAIDHELTVQLRSALGEG